MIIEKAALLAALGSHGLRIAHGPIDDGTDVNFTADREGDQAIVGLEGGEQPRRVLPLGEDGAQALADGVRAHHHHPEPRAKHMLEHLFLRLSEFFEAGDLVTMRVLIRLHENGYTIMEAAAQGPHALHLPREAPPKVRKGTTNGYRPVGRR
ncbi:MAG TPA: hypothetical protein VIK27_10950 [Candidatus Aquilonibacter sp.]